MSIVAADIKFYLSGGGGNTDPDAALGGAISSTEIVDASLHNLFDKVLGSESVAGDIEYRGIYVKNTHGSLTLEVAAAFLTSNTPSADTVIAIALADEGNSATMETIANENTAPSGPSFSAPTDYAGGLSLGDLAPAEYFGLWIRRTVTAGAAAYSTDNAVLTVQGDTA